MVTLMLHNKHTWGWLVQYCAAQQLSLQKCEKHCLTQHCVLHSVDYTVWTTGELRKNGIAVCHYVLLFYCALMCATVLQQ